MRLPLFARLIRFRNELALLWRAFLAPGTPVHLKALMLLVPLYLLSPLDLLPDFIPIAGWLDDAIVIPLLVGWIASLVRNTAPRPANARARRPSEQTIDGTWRRL